MKIKAQKKEKIILYTIFAFYCLILWLALIDRGFIAYLVTKESFLNPIELPRSYNLVPFRLFREQYSKFGITGIIDSNILGNIIMFIPVGIFVCVFTKNKNPYRYIYIIPLVSIFIEITQFILATGSLDIDDVVLNSIGGFIGLGIFAIIYKLSNKNILIAKRFITIVATLLPPYLLIFFYKLFMDIDEVRLRWYDVIVVVVYYLLVSFLFNDCSRKLKKSMLFIYILLFIVFFAFVIYIQ
ncbi:VanZ family protein [Eubacterium sp.]